MSQNAYVVKFTRDLSVADNLIRMAQALNDKNPFFHVPDPIYEQFMQEKYILNGTKESAVSLSGDIKEINEIALKERNKQAKAIF